MVPTRAAAASLALILALSTAFTAPAAAGDAEEAKDGAARIWGLLEKKFKDEKKGEAWLNRKFENRGWFDRIKDREVGERTGSPAPRPPKTPLPTEGVVSEAADGDTLTVTGVGKIRLQGVDSTEKNHPSKPVQYLSEEASRFTRELVLGKRVRLEYGEELHDKYGRVLAFIYLPDGRMLNAELIKAGLAYAYTRYPFKYQQQFIELEARAREQGIGLWSANGLGEYHWLQAQNRDNFEVFEMSSNLWGVRWGQMVLVRLTTDQLRLELEHLRRDVNALGPRDLERELAARGYQKVSRGNA
jgi:micrococcal nuclease